MKQRTDSTRNLQLRNAARNDAVCVLLGDGAAAVAAAGCEDERYGKLKSGTRGAINKRGRGGNGSQVPRANPGCHLELTESAFFFFCWQRFIFGAKYRQNARKRVNIPFFCNNCQISPTQKFECFLPYMESDFNLVTFL
jgi:hypothetical protein